MQRRRTRNRNGRDRVTWLIESYGRMTLRRDGDGQLSRAAGKFQHRSCRLPCEVDIERRCAPTGNGASAPQSASILAGLSRVS